MEKKILGLILALGMVPAASAGGRHDAGVDADLDGVPDSEDWCLGSAAGTRTGPDGCGPGEIGSWAGAGMGAVAAAAPGRPAPSLRDTSRAAIEKTVLRGASFATGSATLRPQAVETLRGVAATLKQEKSLSVEIGGHTDSVGSPERNMALSERRAHAVKDFLVKEGVEASRLTVKGYGQTRPIDTNETAQGRANNRRVEFKAK